MTFILQKKLQTILLKHNAYAVSPLETKTYAVSPLEAKTYAVSPPEAKIYKVSSLRVIEKGCKKTC